MKDIHTPDNAGNSESMQPIEMLKSGQLLSLAHNHSAGLILQKPYYAEFIGPGSAVGGMFDMQCVTVHTLGKTEFEVPETIDERQNAFQKRMEDIETMQQICEKELPIDRAIAVLEMLSQDFLQEEIQTISNEVLAKLVGVLPSTIASAWQQVSQAHFKRNLSQSYQEESAFTAQEVAFA